MPERGPDSEIAGGAGGAAAGSSASPSAHFPVEPLDAYNRALLANVHPPDWVNPRPAARYHLVVVGAGT
ncbi:MAG TPA: hypothetical protein VJA16_09895, partial [Thermoanaerobaculia bacterium]